MNWGITVQIVTIVAVYVGGLLAVGHFISNSLGKRIDDLGNRIDDLGNRIDDLGKRIDDSGKRTDDLREQMSREHDALSNKVDTLTVLVTEHITDYSKHTVKQPLTK